jgi:hypothetical protein
VLIAKNYLDALIKWMVGGHEGPFWVRWEPVLVLLQDALVEPIRLCLLAVAFRRCLELFALRANVEPARTVTAGPRRAAPSQLVDAEVRS